MRKAIEGDARAFDRVIIEKSADLVHIAALITRDPLLAEEAAQEAALIIKSKIGALRKPDSFDSWMYKIVFNECMGLKRRQKKSSANVNLEDYEAVLREENESFIPDDYIENKERRSRVMGALDELSEKQRAATIFYYYEGLSYAEIAEALDISTDDVAVSLHRAKKKLKTLIEQEDSLSEEEPIAEIRGQPKKMFGISALSMIFHKEVASLVTPKMVTNVQEAVIEGGVGLALSSFLFSKAVIFVSGFAVVAAGGFGIHALISGSSANTLDQALGAGVGSTVSHFDSKPFAIKGDPFESKEVEATTEGVPADQDSLTAAIGSADAGRLEDYYATPPNEDEWDDFIDQTELYFVSSAVSAQYQYRVFASRESSDEQYLIVIERKSNTGTVDVAYYTAPLLEDAPSGKAIIDAFATWRGA